MGSICAVNNNINLNLYKIKNAIVLTIAFPYYELYCSLNLSRSKASCTYMNSFWCSVN